MKKTLVIVLAFTLLLGNLLAAQAKELVSFNCSDEWEVITDGRTEDAPRLTDDGSAYGYIRPQDNVYVGTYDFSKGIPTKLTIGYSYGVTQSEIDQYGADQLYIIVGDDLSPASRWWAGPFQIHSTGEWDSYITQTFDVVPGGENVWPTGEAKVWIHVSNANCNLSSFAFSNDEPDTGSDDTGSGNETASPKTGDATMIYMAFAALAAGAGTLLLMRRKHKA